MSGNQIDELIHNIHIASIKHPDPLAIWTADAVNWYVSTARASNEWIAAAARVKDWQPIITKARRGDYSTAGIIKTVTKIIK